MNEKSFMESAFMEFVRVWASGKQGILHLETKNGNAFINMSYPLGNPAEEHFDFKIKKKNPSRQRRDNERSERQKFKKKENMPEEAKAPVVTVDISEKKPTEAEKERKEKSPVKKALEIPASTPSDDKKGQCNATKKKKKSVCAVKTVNQPVNSHTPPVKLRPIDNRMYDRCPGCNILLVEWDEDCYINPIVRPPHHSYCKFKHFTYPIMCSPSKNT